jgi:malate dehydrogenase (oxaloacetate-decarboxylating)(NADP+)
MTITVMSELTKHARKAIPMTTTTKHGIELLHDPSLNKSTAFTEAEKQALGLVGLVPDVTETEDLQLHRVMMQLGHKNTDLDRYIYLINLLDHDATLFYGVVARIRRGLAFGQEEAVEGGS